jgi:ribose/xylose/arabinose/galactoside ABC-type transport system permease subunit
MTLPSHSLADPTAIVIGRRSLASVPTELALAAALAVVAGILAVATDKFLTAATLSNVLRQGAVLAILSVGQTAVVIARGFDLTVGSLLGLSSVVGAAVAIAAGPIVGFLAFLAVGACVGLVNGLLIGRLDLSPIVVTLGGLTLYRGAAIWLTNGRSVSGLPDVFARIGAGSLGPIPYVAFIAGLVIVVGWFVLQQTVFGALVYAVGANPRAAALSGINVGAVRLVLYLCSGILAGLAAFVLTARVSVGQPYFGAGTELDVLAAVFIGGVSIAGGQGRLAPVIVAVFLLSILQTGINLLGFSGFTQGLVTGIVLLGAIAVQRLGRSDGDT